MPDLPPPPRPQPVLLPNGDVMVPAGDPAQGMVRLAPGDPHHAEWLAHLQASAHLSTPVAQRPSKIVAALALIQAIAIFVGLGIFGYFLISVFF